MGFTHFPYGVSSFGAPVLPGPGVIPTGGFPRSTGQLGGYNGVLFVDGTNGSDANDGLTPKNAIKSLDVAYNLTTGGLNEIIYILGGTSAVTYSTAIASAGSGLVWSKSFTHLVGLAAPVQLGQRARLTNGTATNLLTPLLSVTGSGCIFQNIEMFNGGTHATEAAVCLALSTGSRNAFINCQISGGGDATSAADASSRSLTIAGGGGEHFFQHCYIGLDTNDFSAASSVMEFTAHTVRNVFEDCIFSTYSSTGSSFFVKIGAGGIDRFLLFKACKFLNAGSLSGGADLADAMSLDAACGGRVLLSDDCIITGSTATAATKTDLYFENVNGSTTSSKALVAGW